MPVQVAAWGPLVFVNVDGKAPPLLDVLEDLPAASPRSAASDAVGDAQRVGHRLQLEGLRRQLPRGLPRPGRAPGAAQGAGLRQYRVEPRR